MRRTASVLMLALAGGALAAPPPPPLSWADWVGDWSGKLAWSSCSVDGADKATLSIEASDGAVSIDLAPAGAALRELSLAADEAGFAGQQGDLTVRVRRTRSSALELAVTLDSGCEITGTLARTSTGIPACDRLAAWARIESQCTKLTRPALENPARVARQREQWAAARGAVRVTLAEQCTARAAKVETALIDAGCAPSPDPEIGLRGAECQALRSTSARLSRCGNVPLDQRQDLERETVVLVAASQGADKAALPVVEAACKRMRERLHAIGKPAGCPL